MLTWLTISAVWARLLRWSTSSSMPIVNMKRQTPTWLRSRSTPSEGSGKTAANASGISQPKSDGPSRTPAAISPTTDGWPRRTKSFPTSRAAAMITSSCSRSRLSGSLKPVPIAECSAPAAGVEPGAAVWTVCAPPGAGSDAPEWSTSAIAANAPSSAV